MADLNRSEILSYLECPICYEYFSPPTYVCENGHPICLGCYKRVKRCPQCRGEMTKRRSLTLEKICNNIALPCKNRYAGCMYRAKGFITKDHEMRCMYAAKRCPLRWCKWTGLAKDFKHHYRNRHLRFFIWL